MTRNSQVVLRGWKPGLRKVALGKLVREQAQLSLSDAHAHVNRLMTGETLILAVPSAAAEELADEALKLGVEMATVGAPVGL